MFFEKLLQDPIRGKAARDYLASRGINDETARKFRIGLAADGWDHLLKSDATRKFSPEQLHKAGLVKPRDSEKGGGFYDTFRNRLMFPIRDPNGRVIAFGGRVMPGSQDPAKYLNSPETPVFSKSRSIYGLDQARQRIVETQTAVVVEGYTDVVMAHQFGATNVVSPLGTALTEQHVALLRRFAGRIVLLFDPDTAGDLAVDRAVSLFLTQPVEIAIADLGQDLDPDEYLLKYGLDAFEKLIRSAPEALAYKWKGLVRQFAGEDGTNLTGQQKAVETYLELIHQARQSGPVDPIRWGLVLSQVGKLTGIPAEQLHRRLNAAKPTASRSAMVGGPVGAGDSSSERSGKMEQPRRRGVLSARVRAEQMILGSLLLWPAKWHQVQTLLAPEDFTDAGLSRLAEVYWSHQRDEGEPVFNEFLALLGGSNQSASSDEAGGGIVADVGLASVDLRELAVGITEEVEAAAARQQDEDAPLREGLAHLNQAREAEEKQKLIAAARMSGQQKPDQDAEADVLRRLSAKVPGAKL